MTDVDLAAAALAELKQTVRGLSGYSPPPRSHWGKALDSLGQVTIDTKSRDLAVAELRMTTVGYDYFVKKGVTPGPGSHWGKALAYIAEIGVTLKVTVSAPSGTLTGTVTVSASAAPSNQASTITRVEFYVDGAPTPAATDTTAPYTFPWNTTSVPDGQHQLKAKAFYPVNKVAEGLLTVNTYNAYPPPPPPPPPPAPPVNSTLPTISGTATEGQTLTLQLGTWTNSPTSYTQQWLRCDAAGANAVAISGATGMAYTLGASDVGKTIRCAVIAYNGVGPSPQVVTAQTGVVAALAGGVPVTVSPPVLSGSAAQGNTVSASNGAWTNVPTSYTYQWQRCGASVFGEQSILTNPDRGNGNVLLAQSATLVQAGTIQSLSFYVSTVAGNLRLGIYSDAGGRPGTKLAETAGFVPVVGWNTANVTTPVALATGTYWLAYLTDSNALGFPKTTDASSSNKGYIFAYGVMPATFSASPIADPSHWSFYATITPTVSCSNISGQTANAYLLTSADVNMSVRCGVVAVNASGSSTRAYSAQTAAVSGPPPPSPPPPTGNPYLDANFANGGYSPSMVTVFESYTVDNRIASTWGGLSAIEYDANGMTHDTNQRVYLVAPPVPLRGQSWVSRQEVRKSDGPWGTDGNAATYDKSTIRSDPPTTLGGAFSFGMVRWFAYDYLLPLNLSGSTFNFVTGGDQTLMDLHETATTVAQSWNVLDIGTVRNDNGRQLGASIQSTGNTGPTGLGDYRRINYLNLTDPSGNRITSAFNVWHQLVVGVKFSDQGVVGNSPGWLEIWHDGVNVMPRELRPTSHTGSSGVWLQAQMYLIHLEGLVGGANSTVVYFGGMRAGLTMADVVR